MRHMERGDFYEDDEPVDDVVAAFTAGEPVVTARPVETKRGWTSFLRLRSEKDLDVTYTASTARARLT